MVVTSFATDFSNLPIASPLVGEVPDEDLSSFQVVGAERHLGTTELFNVEGKPFARAIRISTQVGATQEWHVQVSADMRTTIKPGDVVLARFWFRCVESMTGQGVVGFGFETNDADQQIEPEVRLSTGGDWVECFVPLQAKQNFLAGNARISFHVGYDRQVIELAGISVTNFGGDGCYADLPRTKLTYPGRQPTSEWRQAAAERIERYRKNNLLIEVVDAEGKPLSNATVDIVLRRHAFGFGAAIKAKWINDPSSDGERYREVLQSLFNQATFDNEMKWPAVYDGVPAATDTAISWLREREIKIRGHNLIWPSWRWLPRQLQAYRYDVAALRREAAAHITRTVAHFRSQLIHWDVVNEPFSEHDLIDLLGRDAMVEWFNLAREADPAVKLFLNDYGIFDSGNGKNQHADHFYDTLRFLRDAGALLDGIGIQSHFTADLPSPQALFGTLERFSKLGLPIESTELTVNLEDRQLQADYLRDYMTVLFSHPNVNGITLWGFWAKGHWRPQSAFFEEDWSMRPVGHAFNELVHKQWTTRASTSTNPMGLAHFRGFCGTYDVTVTTDNGQIQKTTAHIGHNGGRLRVTAGRRSSPAQKAACNGVLK